MQIKQLNYQKRLQDVNIDLPNKGLIGVVGENGAGKSTLLKCIAGIIPPNSGEILFNNKNLALLSIKQKSNYISYLHQNTPILWNINVDDLILLGLVDKNLNKMQMQQRLCSVCDCFDLTNLRKQSVYSLSGGELARAHLARATIADTPILLVDEPMASLDPFYKLEIMSHLQKLAENQLVILVIHDLVLASEFCEYFVILKNGKVMAKGNRENVITTDIILQNFSVIADVDTNHRIVKISKQKQKLQ